MIMRILLVSDDLLPGGTARFVVSLANELHERGAAVAVAATDGDFRRFINSTIQFIPLFLYKKKSYSKNLFGIFFSVIRLWRLLNSGNFDIVHSHKRYSHFLVSMLLWNRKIKHITHFASVFQSKKKFTRYGVSVLCCSEAVRNNLIKNFHCPPEISTTIYHGINPLRRYSKEEQEKIRKLLCVEENQALVSSIGQYVPLKDREGLIHSINLLRNKVDLTCVRFFLLGYGPQEQYLKQLVDELQLGETVKFLEGTFDVEALINISDFLILNSTEEEGFGIVLLEAASVGKMHIGSNAGGIPEFIEHEKTSLLVEPRNPDQLCDAIVYCLTHTEKVKEMGTLAEQKYKQYFTFQRMVNAIVHHYQITLEQQ